MKVKIFRHAQIVDVLGTIVKVIHDSFNVIFTKICTSIFARLLKSLLRN